MSPRMLTEMIGAHKSLGADGAREVLLAGVRPQMAREFVGAGESFVTQRPGTPERSFTCVSPGMRFQV